MAFVAGGMTGGGWGRRSGVPLAERVRAGSETVPPPAREDVSPVRHCWVDGALDVDGGIATVRRPGLLVEWRQAAVGWEGRVLYSTRLRGRRDGGAPTERVGEWVVVEEWLPAARLTPL